MLEDFLGASEERTWENRLTQIHMKNGHYNVGAGFACIDAELVQRQCR